MIKYLQIENFKSLKRTSLALEKLNLLFGMNGMGKSSVIQALLLLRQSYWSKQIKNLQSLDIKGELVDLGTSKDILCQFAENDEMRFLVQFGKDKRLDVSYPTSAIPVGRLKALDVSNAIIPFAEEEPLFDKAFCYLGANHIGPKNEYGCTAWDREGINPMGVHGEYTVPFLAVFGDEFHVPGELCLSEAKTDRLFDQVSAWMSLVSPGIKISARYLPMEEKAKLDISYTGKRLDTEPFLPVNVGFGIPYVLPIVVALLTSSEKSMIMIENPESHLHPRGQSKIAELIAKSAARGAQIICESHSDHIINGVRVAIKEGYLRNNDLSIVYFDKDDEQITKTTEISVDEKGNLSDYPIGLLDEWGIQMSQLL